MSTTRLYIARNLAAAFLSGAGSLDAVLRRGALAWGRKERWLRPLVRRVLPEGTDQAARPTMEAVARLIEADPEFQRAWLRSLQAGVQPLSRVFWVPPIMAPASGRAATWQVPLLGTPAAVADWLGLQMAELDWFADCRGREADTPPGPLRHYSYAWLPGRSGKWRLLEAPKPRLKAIQGRILHEILDPIPPHDAAHGYRRGRSVVTFAGPHCGQPLVLRFDLRHFFPSVRASRVHGLFAAAGYPRDVARLLTGLCTNVVPAECLETLPGAEASSVRDRVRSAHLPQGAPTSPALANLCGYRLDCRLEGLARSVGARYTRYADDLAFSGGEALQRSARRFQVHVCRIALEEGFEVHTRKSRFMHQGVCQQLVGVVVNAHPNLRRQEFDRLKATLYNCVRLGPASQDRQGHADFRSHLMGRITHVAHLNPGRGRRLRDLFARIVWDEG